ncbi:DUF1501 domain-containing protein [Pandoraea thiooxydans]|nr:DUF1501 domain-containing protein [Pandoraea thiooxydans]
MAAMVTRRKFISLTAAGAGAILVSPQLVFANVQTEHRFVFVIQRGAADGLSTVVPYGDPAYAGLRAELAIDAASAIKLDGLFALHPSLVETGRMYAAGQALFVHAVASPYRQRSHFDGQNVLESGGTAPYQLKDGWLNRLVTLLPKSRERAIALAPTVPLALRGRVEVASYAPSALPSAPDDLLMRVSQLYEHDAQLHPLWASAMQTQALAGDMRGRQDPAGLGKLAAKFLARPDGPRIAMIETGGWDTHDAQNPRLAARLKALDTMLAALRDQLGPVWGNTTVLVATEFGRTAAANGTSGTDHGTGAVAMLVGGAVKGGRVLGDWPGLGAGALYQNRDLKPTTALDALIAAAAAQSLRLDTGRVAHTLFPAADMRGAPRDLMRT